MKVNTQRQTPRALTFDDVLIVPAYSDVQPREIDIKTSLTQSVSLNVPLLSAAMDTVTESALAIALAEHGGIGIIHKNMSIEDQAEEVLKVKKYESGIIQDPITIHPQATISDAVEITQKNDISAIPVVDGELLKGIVTGRDLRFASDLQAPLSSVMTPQERLITIDEGNISREQVIRLLHQHRLERILVTGEGFTLRGMITVKDILKSTNYPDASKDERERLLAGAAIGVGGDMEERVEALLAASVDVLVIDTAHGHSENVLKRIRWLRSRNIDVQLIGGNIATRDAALALKEAGVDAVKVGIGPGSICTTRVISGIGVPQVTAITEVANALRDSHVSVIADGGIRFSGDIAKAIAAGADSVMLGGIFAGTDEAPGEIEYYQGRAYKSYRGMGSMGAMRELHGSADRYFQDYHAESGKIIPEGVEGRVPYKGSVRPIITQLCGGLRSSMGYAGAPHIDHFQRHAQLIEISQAGIVESHVHDVTITKQAPNYHI